MTKHLKTIRSLVQRQGAEDNLLLILISFAGTVVTTRLYLSLTGYPALRTHHIHIAHVLWGGLILFVAALLPLLFTNRKIYALSSILAGCGVGLFIDEVGKFITQSNDYFYQPAATIIYAVFLLVVLLYVHFRKPTNHTARTELYHALDILEEFLDNDLDKDEYKELTERLSKISQETSYPELSQLAKSILDFLKKEKIKFSENELTKLEKFESELMKIEKRFISRNNLRILLTTSFFLFSLGSISNIAMLTRLAISHEYVQVIIAHLLAIQTISSSIELVLFLLRLLLDSIAGIIFLSSVYLMLFKHEKKAISYAQYGLLFSLTTINLLAFYFDQFRAVVGSLVQLGVLLALLRYKMLYLDHRVKHPSREA